MDRLDGLQGSRSGSKNGEPNTGELTGRRQRTSMNSRVGEGHMDQLEEERVHPAMPHGTISHGAQTSEEVQLATDRPQTNERRKIHLRLGDVIQGTGVMRIKEEVIPAIRTGGKIHRPSQGAVILKRGIQGTLHQWPQSLNI